MKPAFRLLAALAVLLLGHQSNRAAVISGEAFAYPANTAIASRNGGKGWQGAWSGAGTNVTPGLATPDAVRLGGGLRTAGNNSGAFRSLVASGWTELRPSAGRFGRDGTELWFSFLIRREAAFPANGYGGVSLFNGAFEEIFIGMPTGSTNWSFQQFDLGAAPGNITAAASRPIIPGETVQLVLRFVFGVNGTQDRVEMFVNPSPEATPTTPDAVRTGADHLFDRVRVQSGPAGSAAPVTVDEILLGTSFADVARPVPGTTLTWSVTGNPRVSAGTEITVPLTYLSTEADPDTLTLSVAPLSGVVPAEAIFLAGTGTQREVTFRPPAGVSGNAQILARLHRPDGSLAVDALLTLSVLPPLPDGLLAYEPFDYLPTASPLNGQDAGQGFGDAWTAGAAGIVAGNAFVIGTTNLPYPGLTGTGTRTRTILAGSNAIRRSLAVPLGEEGTTRYLSLLVRGDNPPAAGQSFGLLLLSASGPALFAGKPATGEFSRFVLEAFGGAGQIASARTLTPGRIVLLVLKLESRAGPDRVSLYVDPPLDTEPTTADAVKEDLDLGVFTGLGLTGSTSWSADEIRVATTYSAAVPADGGFALKPIVIQDVNEGATLSLTVEPILPPAAGESLHFEFVGDAFGATLQPGTGAFSWSPGELEGGQTRRFTVKATVTGTPPATNQISFHVRVTESNQRPEFAPIPDQQATAGSEMTYQLVATDADMPAQPIRYSPRAIPSGLSVTSAGLIRWTPDPTQGGQTFPVTVVAADSMGGLAETTFNIRVLPRPDPTSLRIARTRHEGGAFRVTCNDVPGAILVLRRSTDLLTWAAVAGAGIERGGAEATLSDPAPPEEGAFYEVRAEP